MTSSVGCISPTWRLPMIRSATMMARYSTSVRRNAVDNTITAGSFGLFLQNYTGAKFLLDFFSERDIINSISYQNALTEKSTRHHFLSESCRWLRDSRSGQGESRFASSRLKGGRLGRLERLTAVIWLNIRRLLMFRRGRPGAGKKSGTAELGLCLLCGGKGLFITLFAGWLPQEKKKEESI